VRIGTCHWCGKQYQKKRPEQVFCSRSHSKMGRSGERNNGWKGGRRVHKQSGRMTVLQDGKHVLEHRVLKNAPKHLIVHHRDEDLTNNAPDNLELMSRSEHTRLHNYLNPRRGHQRDVSGRFAPGKVRVSISVSA
jgi:hypothetical protein